MEFDYEEYIQYETSGFKDELLVILAVIALFSILIMVDAFNVVTEFAKSHPEYYLDKIILLQIPLFVMAVWGSSLQFRRKKDLVKSYYVDRLTTLPNRLAFKVAYDHRLNNYLIVLNIVDFKTVNKTLGLEEGDEMLKQASLLLQQIVKKHTNEELYRLYGDEFAFFTNCDQAVLIKERLSRIQSEFQKCEIKTDDIEVKFDIHLSFSNVPSKFKTAMMAMEYARAHSGNQIFEYKSFMNNSLESKNNVSMLKVIKEAIEHNQLYPVFQGMVDNQNGQIIKYEALARIKRPSGEILLPEKFIDLSKRLKLYHEITKTMIDKSFKIFNKREEALSINLTYNDIRSKEVTEYLYYKLKEYRNVAGKLTVEIVETESIDDYEKLLSFYKTIKVYGCKLSIDDFGSGYSNIMNLFKLQPDYIKIDGSIIQNIHTNQHNKVFIKSIVGFAKSYNIKTVAEYVSSRQLAQTMTELGIDISQGFYYDHPKELDSITMN